MKDFEYIYKETLEDIKHALKDMDIKIFAKHNKGFEAYKNTENLVSAFYEEKKRYKKSYDFILNLNKEHKVHSILDIGCLFGILPIILKKANFNIEIHVIENFSFYGNSLNPVKSVIRSHSIEIHDVDIIQSIPFSENYFDLVTLLAVIEHLSISPIKLMCEIRRILTNGGFLIIDTPNVCSLTRRINFLLRGIPPYASLKDFLFSETPFTGHYREYSIKDLYKLLKYSGFATKSITTFNLGSYKNTNLRKLILQCIIPWLFPNLKNYIWCCGKVKK